MEWRFWKVYRLWTRYVKENIVKYLNLRSYNFSGDLAIWVKLPMLKHGQLTHIARDHHWFDYVSFSHKFANFGIFWVICDSGKYQAWKFAQHWNHISLFQIFWLGFWKTKTKWYVIGNNRTFCCIYNNFVDVTS